MTDGFGVGGSVRCDDRTDKGDKVILGMGSFSVDQPCGTAVARR